MNSLHPISIRGIVKGLGLSALFVSSALAPALAQQPASALDHPSAATQPLLENSSTSDDLGWGDTPRSRPNEPLPKKATQPQIIPAKAMEALDPVLATIDGVAITEQDADALRGILQPPPSREAAKRLAVDAALAWWDIHGWLAGSSSHGRLNAWRAWLLAADRSADLSSVDALEGLSKRAARGESGSARAIRAGQNLRSRNGNREVPSLTWVRIAADGSRDSNSVSIPLSDLERALALAARDLTDGESRGPIEAPSGTYYLKRSIPVVN